MAQRLYCEVVPLPLQLNLMSPEELNQEYTVQDSKPGVSVPAPVLSLNQLLYAEKMTAFWAGSLKHSSSTHYIGYRPAKQYSMCCIVG